MKRNSLLTAILIMFIFSLLMLSKVFAANGPINFEVQCNHEECVARGFHLNR